MKHISAQTFREYYWANKSKIQETKRKYSADNREELKIKTRQWHKENPEKSLLISARSRANRGGIPFDLVLEDIKIPIHCPVLGIPLVVKEGRRTDATPSLDRIIPAVGYVRGNIKIISWRANRLKCDASLAELESLLAYMKDSINENDT